MSECIVNKNYILIDGVNDGDKYGISDFADNENQYDDVISDENKKKDELLMYWKNLPQYPQKSKAWLEQRSQYIGGSDAGAALGYNKYEPKYKFIWKKLETIPFNDFTAVYHGNKYEDVVNMIYEWIYNVKVNEYGFLTHRTIDILGASPDSITSQYKLDGIHNSNLERVMIEIKCPTSRKINMDPNADLFDVIPIYYYCQVQQQMEVCDLEYCDFFQLKINEYQNFKEFKTDTSDKCYFKSKDGKFKGAVIQILPIKDFQGDDLKLPNKQLKQKIYAHAKFIHQPKLNMSCDEIKKWILDVKNQNIPDVQNEELLNHYKIRDGFFFNCVKFWKCENGRCKRIKRSREWINEHMDKYYDIWNTVLFFREHEELSKLYCDICRIIDNEVFIKTPNINAKNQERMEKVIKVLMGGNEDEIEKIKDIYFNGDDDIIDSPKRNKIGNNKPNKIGFIEE